MPDRGGELVDLFVRDLDRIELPPRDRWRPAPRKESAFMRASRTILYAGAVAAVLVAAVLAGLALRDGGQVAATPSPVPATNTPPPASSAPAAASDPPPKSAPPPPSRSGTITGALGYPSNFVPPLTVYAISVADPRVFFSVNTPRFGGDATSPPTGATPAPRPSYTITGVAPGTYYVLAYRNDEPGQSTRDFPGLYSQYVLRCKPGAPSADCADHTLVPVTVNVGPAVSGIDVTDWYHGSPSDQPRTTYPPRPR
jgi:hypothetical protein